MAWVWRRSQDTLLARFTLRQASGNRTQRHAVPLGATYRHSGLVLHAQDGTRRHFAVPANTFGDAFVRRRSPVRSWCGPPPAASLAAGEYYGMRGEPFPMRMYIGFPKPKKDFVVGLACAGVVEAVGKDVTRFQPGDEVYGEVPRLVRRVRVYSAGGPISRVRVKGHTPGSTMVDNPSMELGRFHGMEVNSRRSHPGGPSDREALPAQGWARHSARGSAPTACGRRCCGGRTLGDRKCDARGRLLGRRARYPC